jgi:putative acetyltransferase
LTAPPAGVTLRPERPGEADEVDALVIEAFGRPVLGDLLTSLRSNGLWGQGLSIVATAAGGSIIGSVVLTRGWLDAPRSLVDVLVLSPLAVAATRRGEGIGSALVRHGLAAVESRGEPLVFLEGAPSFYQRLGFQPAAPLGFLAPSVRIPEMGFMVSRTASYQPWMTGTLVYSDAFWRHDCVGLREDADTRMGNGASDPA